MTIEERIITEIIREPEGEAMSPTIGRIVLYCLGDHDAEAVNRRRVQGAGHGESWPAGAQAHFGNSVKPGDEYPMIVSRVWENYYSASGTHAVNGQVFLDGNDTLWVTSANEGTGPCTWRWPTKV